MNNNKNLLINLIWIIPAIIAFLLALIPTLKYQWPLSWDTISTILSAQLYAKYGFVLINPFINAPYGDNINYPPLFYLLLAFLGNITHVNLYQIARVLQPFLAMFVVLSVSYVSRKFYGNIAGVSTGFLILSSLLLGNRLIFPLPENLALIFLPLSVYFYYYSLKNESLKHGILAGFLFILIFLIHPAAPVVLFTVIVAITLIELILYRNILAFKYYGAFLLPSIMGVLGVFALLPSLFNNIVHQKINLALSISSAINIPIGLLSYGNLGVLTLIFGLIGAIAAIKSRQKKDIFIISWIIVVILLINAYLFGINVYSYRLLVYLLIPVSILGGFGLSEVYNKLKNYKNFSSQNFRMVFLISIFALATFDGFLTMENPLIATDVISNQYGVFQISPPSPSDVDLANWFKEHGDKSKSIMSNDYFPLIFVATQSGMSISDIDFFKDFTNNDSYYAEMGVGYIVLDKRLSFQSNNGTLYTVEYYGELYPLFYYSGNIQSNLNEILPGFVKVVYTNKDFIVCEIQ
jgi:asparagine N-glycosylation enzyme membrane subunit Stt3